MMPFSRLVIDYGHGAHGLTPGKRYQVDGGSMIFEGDLNREIASKLLSNLLPGYEVWDALKGRPVTLAPFVLGLCERDVALSSRVGTANRLSAASTLYLSLHCDAVGSADHGPSLPARGFSVYTSPGETASDRAATVIHAALAASGTGIPARADRRDGDPDHEADFYVLRETHCPAVLVEMGFFTSADDLRILTSNAGQDAIALALASAVRQLVIPAVGR